MAKTVFVNGCFDLFHYGHLSFLVEASRLGNQLMVGINSDESVNRIKGECRPILSQDERKLTLSLLPFVYSVHIFNEDEPSKIIEELKPDIVVKSDFYRQKDIPEAPTLERLNIPIVYLKEDHDVSTSLLITRVLSKARKE